MPPRLSAEECTWLNSAAISKIHFNQFLRALSTVLGIDRRKFPLGSSPRVRGKAAGEPFHGRDVRDKPIGVVIGVAKALLRDMKLLTWGCLDILASEFRQMRVIVRLRHD